MKVLVWSFPWASQGNGSFYKNCFVNHLLVQANTLVGAGHLVDIFYPEIFKVDATAFNEKLRIISLSNDEFLGCTKGITDQSVDLYVKDKKSDTTHLELFLKGKLGDSYDVVLLWETPVPFLENMFPEALFIHQMPGAFSRAPYPNTVVFDPVGLFRHGLLHRDAKAIIRAGDDFHDGALREVLAKRVFQSSRDIAPFTRTSLDPNAQFTWLRLLPLQVSTHYAFTSDTGFKCQEELMEAVMESTPSNVGVVVTQYVHGHAQDKAINLDNLGDLQKKWPNLIYDPAFDRFPSVSQYLLPVVDDVVTCSSSIGMQALLWGYDLHIMRPTFLSPYQVVRNGENKHGSRAASRNVVDFCLERHQPLAEKILHDGEFLTNLLESTLHKKRSGYAGVDLTTRFVDIDPNYFAGFEKAINVSKAKRIALREYPEIEGRITDSGKFARAIRSEEVETISFDVFDTLICRPVEAPADIYTFLECAVAEELGNLADGFSKVRLTAEVTVRKNSTRGEITLDEIYDYIATYYGIARDRANKLKEIELELELDLIKPRPLGRVLFDIAKRSKKNIILVSDMYLPTFQLERMLAKCGYDRSSYGHFFVSSDHGVRKKEGGLFDVVLKELGRPAESILHVGDNVIADIDEPKKRGMKAFRLVRSLDRIRRNKLYYEIFNPRVGAGEIGRSVIVGTIASKLFEQPPVEGWEQSLFFGDAYKLGYAGLGPVLLGFTLWLKRKAHADGVSNLFFLSREGWLFKAAYDALSAGDSHSIQSTYLLASRRATRVAAIIAEDDIASVAVQPYSAGITLGGLLSSRFGIEPSNIDEEVIQIHGYHTMEDVLVADADCKSRFVKLCFSITDLILKSSLAERSAYLAYLEDAGFSSATHPAVVDIGWKGNMQASLGNLIGRPVTGYYLATLDGAQTWLSRGHHLTGYMGDFLSKSYNNDILENRHVCEFLFCAATKSLVSIGKGEKSFVLNFRDEPDYQARKALIERVHHGAIDFCRDIKRAYSNRLNDIYIDPHLATRVLQVYLSSPTKFDAKILATGAFEDGFGGVVQKGLLAADRSSSVWKAGFDILNGVKKTDLDGGKELKNKAGQSRIQSGRAIANVERALVKTLCSEKIFRKYQRDRESFFHDSRSIFFKTWHKLLG